MVSGPACKILESIGVAEHGLPDDEGPLLAAFKRVVQQHATRYPAQRFVWVHPGLWFARRSKLGLPALRQMVDRARQARIWVEINRRYGLPPRDVIDEVEERTIVGLDAHSEDDILRFIVEANPTEPRPGPQGE